MSNRRLSAIMFADIVGYTAMMQRNEQEGLAKVRQFSSVMEEQVASHQGEILQFLGDGCLCIFQSAVQAMHAAKAIQITLKSEPQVPLRIGIHIGDIVMQEGNVYGDGVNLASRVESMGVAGSVLVTERVIHDVKSHPEFIMTSLGKFQFKNVAEPMGVFALANEGFAVPHKKQMGGKLEQRERAKVLPWLAIGLISVLATFGFWFWQSENGEGKIDGQENASLAVLPFVNMNKDEEGDMFCDGMIEDILTYLSKVKDLKVISRTSAMHYRESDKKIPEIAKELDVAHVVEGSVRIYGNKARINVRLVNVAQDQQLWAENFDRDLADIFKVQSEVAQQIVQALQINLTVTENSRLKTTAITNREAYQLYVKGKRAADSRTSEGLAQSVNLLQSAIALDSSFADAYANLALTYFLQATRISENDSTERQKRVLQAELMAMEALAMEDQNLTALSTLGGIANVRGDLQKKKEIMEKTLSLAPNNATVNHNAAFYYEAIGDDERTLFFRKKAFALDPFLFVYHYNYISRLAKTGQSHKAREQLSKTAQLFPEDQSRIALLKGRIALSESDFQAAVPFFEQSIHSDPWLQAPLGFCYAKTGQKDKALGQIDQISPVPRITYYKDLAIIYAGLGQEDSVYHYLNLAVDQQQTAPFTLPRSDNVSTTLETILRKDLYFEELRKEWRFQAIIERLD